MFLLVTIGYRSHEQLTNYYMRKSRCPLLTVDSSLFCISEAGVWSFTTIVRLASLLLPVSFGLPAAYRPYRVQLCLKIKSWLFIIFVNLTQVNESVLTDRGLCFDNWIINLTGCCEVDIHSSLPKECVHIPSLKLLLQ